MRELLRQRTTCAPGRRFVDGLESNGSREDLESAFALIREAREWLRLGRELGFGGLADPQGWMERLESPGVALEPADFLDAGSLLETSVVAAPAISGRSRKNFHCWPARAAAPCRFQRIARGHPPMHFSERRDQRRCFARAASNSRQHPADARFHSANPETDFALAASGIRRGLRHPAQRPLRDPGAVRASPQHPGRGARRQRHGTDGFRRALRNRRDQQSNGAACRRRSRGNFSHPERADRSTCEQCWRRLQSAAADDCRNSTAFSLAADSRAISMPACRNFPPNRNCGWKRRAIPVLEDKLRRENRPIVPMSLALGGDERLAGDQRSKHRRKNSCAEDHRAGRLGGASGNSRCRAARRALDCSIACSSISATNNPSPPIFPHFLRTC